MTDLAETIARWRKRTDIKEPNRDTKELTRLLDAAEAGLRARDAALEEAAQIAEDLRGTGGGYAEYPSGWDGACGAIELAIRKRKGAA